MNTLRTGSLARNTFTFCCTKCFFFVLVFGASITIGLDTAPELPRDAMTTRRGLSLVPPTGGGDEGEAGLLLAEKLTG